MTLKDYAQIKFMSAIISNADTMREITRAFKQHPTTNKYSFEGSIARIANDYADAFLKQR